MVFPWFSHGFARPLDPEIVVALRSSGRGPIGVDVETMTEHAGFNDGLIWFNDGLIMVCWVKHAKKR